MTADIMDFDIPTEPYTYVSISSLVIVGKQIERLQEQLSIATKALKRYREEEKMCISCYIDEDGVLTQTKPLRIATNALEEMAGVK